MTAFRHDYADLGDVELHYVTAGPGNAVLLPHGIPKTWSAGRHVIPVLTLGGAKSYGGERSAARGFDNAVRVTTTKEI